MYPWRDDGFLFGEWCVESWISRLDEVLSDCVESLYTRLLLHRQVPPESISGQLVFSVNEV
jgi:hypothetical protein